jgi:WD40 repeat protein
MAWVFSIGSETFPQIKRRKKSGFAQACIGKAQSVSSLQPAETSVMSFSSNKQFIPRFWRSTLRMIAVGVLSLNAGAQNPVPTTPCSSKVLVSGYFSNNVHIYNACTGAFERVLDDAGRIQGPQATRVLGGKIYVVSEGNDRILRYSASTFDYEAVSITLPVGFGGTGLAIRGDEAYVAGYNTDSVNRYSLSTGQLLGVAIAPSVAGLSGADNGAVFGPDGKLYVPSFDNNTVVRLDLTTGLTSVFIDGNTSRLFEPRGILFEPAGNTVLVSGEASGEVQRFNASTGSFIGKVVTGLSRPTGLTYASDGTLLVVHRTGVSKYDPITGAARGSLLIASESGLNGPTFVTVFPTVSAIDVNQIGTQFWVAGLGVIAGNSVTVDPMYSANGAAFGISFKPEDVKRKPWGKVRIDWRSCTEATLSWTSEGADSAGFGIGSYPLVRLGDSEQSLQCKLVGFANTANLSFIGGHWYGGPRRSGEGLLLDRLADGQVFVAWFTYRPR